MNFKGSEFQREKIYKMISAFPLKITKNLCVFTCRRREKLRIWMNDSEFSLETVQFWMLRLILCIKANHFVKEAKIVKARDTLDVTLYRWRFQRPA